MTQQRRGLLEDVFHLASHVAEELLDLLLLGNAELAGLEVIDEVAVSLVGGHAPGRRVGLGQVAFALQGDHLGAHRRRGDREVGVVGNGGRAHGLGGVDVLDDDGLEDGGLARVEGALGLRGGLHAPGHRFSLLALDFTEC